MAREKCSYCDGHGNVKKMEPGGTIYVLIGACPLCYGKGEIEVDVGALRAALAAATARAEGAEAALRKAEAELRTEFEQQATEKATRAGLGVSEWEACMPMAWFPIRAALDAIAEEHDGRD